MAVAFSPSLDDDEEQKKNAQLSGQSGMLNSGGAQANQAAPTSSGRWTNMMSYVDANKDSTMGTDVANKVGGQIDKANTGVDEAAKGVTKYVGDNSLQGQSGVGASLLTDPSKVQKTDVNKIKSFTGQGFAEGANPFVQKVKDADAGVQKQAHIASNVSDQGGLTDLMGGQNYSGGEKNLDSFLLNTAQPGQQSAVQKIRDKFKTTGADSTARVQGQVDDVKTAGEKSLGIQTGFNANAGQAVGNAQTAVSAAGVKATEKNTASAKSVADYRAGVDPTKNVSASSLIGNQTGLSQEDISQFLSNGGNPADLYNAGDTAVTDDYVDDNTRSQINALSGLGLMDAQTFQAQRTNLGPKVDLSQQLAIKAAEPARLAALQTAHANDSGQWGGGDSSDVGLPPEGSPADLKFKQEAATKAAERAAQLEKLRQQLSTPQDRPAQGVPRDPQGEPMEPMEQVDNMQYSGREVRDDGIEEETTRQGGSTRRPNQARSGSFVRGN